MAEGGKGWSARNNQDQERYDRQIRVPGWDQSKIQLAKVLVAGVGALGCEVSKNLAVMGVGEIMLVDNDVVELSNLSRQMLFTDEDVGKPKAEVAEKRLAEMNRHLHLKTYVGDVRKLSLDTLDSMDALCSCVDNWPARRWLNSAAVELNKPLVDVSTEGLYGNVQNVLGGTTACIECHGETLIPREVRQAECTLRRRRPEELAQEIRAHGIDLGVEAADELFAAGIKTVYDIRYASHETLSELSPDTAQLIQDIRSALVPKVPALQSVAATISGLAVAEILKILHAGTLGKPVSGLIVYDAMNTRVTRVPLRKNENCFVCGPLARAQETPLKLDGLETVADVKQTVASLYLYPDVELQYKTKLLQDAQPLSELMLKTGDLLYAHTSRRAQPLVLRVVMNENSSRGGEVSGILGPL